MPKQITKERAQSLDKILEEVKKTYPVEIKDEHYYSPFDPSAHERTVSRGINQWREIQPYLQSRGVTRTEMHLMFIALRGHYNWRFAPSVTTLIYMIKIGENSENQN